MPLDYAQMLDDIRDSLAKGERRRAPVRTMLSWFNAERRGTVMVQNARA